MNAEPVWREAFCLLTYAGKDEVEVLWNSRDGAVPVAAIRSRMGEPLFFRSYGPSVPWYEPGVGERIFVDLTEQRARVLAAERLARMEADRNMFPLLDSLFATRQEALESAFRDLYERGAPDILVVTSGFLEELRGHRALVPPPLARPSPALSAADQRELAVYDRTGRRISWEAHGAFFSDPKYGAVEITRLSELVLVRTKWSGFHFGEPGEEPMIFETQLQVGEQRRCLARYSTEMRARVGHDQIVEIVRELVSVDPHNPPLI